MMAKMSHKMCRLAVAMTVTTVLVPDLPASAAITYDTRALTGDAAPGTTGVYSTFKEPVIDDAGRVAFRGRLLKWTGGVTWDNEYGLWSEGSGSLSLVAREGSIAPGTTGVYNFLQRLVLNGAGQSAFVEHLLDGPGGERFVNGNGIWSDRSGSVSLLVREGDAAPGITGGVFADLNGPLFNDAGQMAFLGALRVGTAGVTMPDRMGLWSEGSGSLSLIARNGDVAPGTGGAFFNLEKRILDPDGDGGTPGEGFGLTALNDAGQVAFTGHLLPGAAGVTLDNDAGIWAGASGSINLVARKGSTAPGTAGGVFGSFHGNPGFNNAGHIVFKSYLLAGSGDVTSANDAGIWSDRSGSLALVAREGAAAPGTAGVYHDINDNLALNGAGQIAFHGRLTGPGVTLDNNEGIWSEGSGSLSLVAREGSPAPGTGSVFRSFSLLANSLILNGAGQVAFNGILRTGMGGVTLANDRGIWATDTAGELKLIAREGDLFDVNDDPLIDDFRTIRSVVLFGSGTGGEEGRSTPFNDAGQLAFKLFFTDRSEGIFVASIQADVAALAGDLNGDGFVGLADLDVLRDNWNRGTLGGDSVQGILSGAPLIGDLNGDGFVGIDDASVILSNLNAGTLSLANVVSIPEPGTVGVLGLCGMVLLRRRRSAC